MLMLSVTFSASGADLAKFWRYLREKVSETCCWRMIEMPMSLSSSVALACGQRQRSGMSMRKSTGGAE